MVSNTSIKGGLLESVTASIIEKFENAGGRITALVCDQGSNNRSLYNKLKIFPEQPYFIRNYKKIYAFYCTPHLIKSVRNYFMDNTLKTLDGFTNWSVIKELYEMDKDNNVTRMCPKLTPNHIEPNSFGKMRVSYATQILSSSVASGIRTGIRHNSFSSQVIKYAEPSALLCEKFNKLFDIFNTRSANGPNIFKIAIQGRIWSKKLF